MKNLNHSVIVQILESGKEFIQEQTDYYVAWYNKKISQGVDLTPLTEYAITIYRLNIQYSLIKALGNYLLDTDKIENLKFGIGAKGVEIVLNFTRDGENHFLVTDVIIAHGEVQCRHYRYLVNTSVRKLNVDLTKRLKGIEKAQYDVDYYKNVVARYEDDLNDIMNINFEEWLTKRSYHFRDAVKNNTTYAEVIAKHPFYKDMLQEEFDRYKGADKKKYAEGLVKRSKIDLAKKLTKLETVIASKS